MCGLCGFVGNKKSYLGNKDFLNDSLVTGALRGMDSTGIATVQINTKGEVYVRHHKRALWGPDFMQLKLTEKILWGAELYNVAMIHHRAGTTGDITDENAHPYWIDHIVGAHNGTLNGAGGLEDYSVKDHTDSWNIFNNMANLDELTTLKSLAGAYVLTWVNLKEKTFNIARNEMRPLACLWEKDEDQMYWASEGGMLRWLTDRNSFTTEDKMFEPGELTWYKFPIEEPRKYEKIKYEKWAYKKSFTIVKASKKTPIRQVLENFKLNIGDKLAVCPVKFVPMEKRPERGHIECLYTDEDFCQLPLTIYDQPAALWESCKDKKYIECTLTAARLNDKNGTDFVGKFVRILPDRLPASLVDVEVESLNPPNSQVVYGPKVTMISREKWHELADKGCSDCGTKLDILDHKIVRWTVDSLPMCDRCWKEAWLFSGEQK